MTDLTIVKGSTFSRVLRWEAAPFVYKAISAITKAGPVSITAAGHGLVDGWRVAVASAGGMRQINAKNNPPRASDFHKATVGSSSVITLNDVDSTNFTAFTSGGSLVYYTPVSLAGFSARMMIRASLVAAGDPLLSLVSPTNIVLDDTLKTITLTITAAATAALTFASGVYDFEMVSGDLVPVVTKLLSGNIIVTGEATR